MKSTLRRSRTSARMVGRLVNGDDLEERIRAYGSRWRDAHPFTSNVDTSRLSRNSRGKAVVAIVAAAAVVAVAFGIAVVVRQDGPSKAHPVAPPTSGPTSTSSETTTTSRSTSPVAIPLPDAPAEQTQVPLDRTGAPLAVGNGRVWVGTVGGLAVFDPVTMHRVGHVATAQPVVAVASSANDTWIVTGSSQSDDASKNPPWRLEPHRTIHAARHVLDVTACS